MGEFYIKYFKDGVRVSSYHCADELKVIEKGIELFKGAGGKVGYKRPEDGEKVISNITGKLLESDDVHNPTGYRLTFTPPKPEPVESEWEKLKRELKGARAKVFTYDVVKVMDELDRRCPAGGGK